MLSFSDYRLYIKFLGHSSVKVTESHYVGLIQSLKTEYAIKYDKVLSDSASFADDRCSSTLFDKSVASSNRSSSYILLKNIGNDDSNSERVESALILSP